MSWCGGGEMRPTPWVEWRTLAITASTLWPGNCPPSPGFAPCAILICIMSELTRYSAVTPKRPEATCLMALRIESPFGQPLVAIGLLAALAGVGLAADPVHGDGERGMRLARDRAERHRPGRKALDDRRGRLDLVERHRRAAVFLRGLDAEETADGQQLRALLVEQLGEGVVAVARVAAHGVLQQRHRLRRPDCASLRARDRRIRRRRRAPCSDRRIAERVRVAALRLLARFRLGPRPRSRSRCRRRIRRRMRATGRPRRKSARRNRTGRWRCPSST